MVIPTAEIHGQVESNKRIDSLVGTVNTQLDSLWITANISNSYWDKSEIDLIWDPKSCQLLIEEYWIKYHSNSKDSTIKEYSIPYDRINSQSVMMESEIHSYRFDHHNYILFSLKFTEPIGIRIYSSKEEVYCIENDSMIYAKELITESSGIYQSGWKDSTSYNSVLQVVTSLRQLVTKINDFGDRYCEEKPTPKYTNEEILKRCEEEATFGTDNYVLEWENKKRNEIASLVKSYNDSIAAYNDSIADIAWRKNELKLPFVENPWLAPGFPADSTRDGTDYNLEQYLINRLPDDFKGWRYKITIRCYINTDGSLHEVEVLKKSKNPDLDKFVIDQLESAGKWSLAFDHDNKVVRSWRDLSFRF